MSIRLVFVTGLVLLSGVSTSAEDYSDLLDEAIETIDWDFEEEWAFTETSLHEEKLFVGHYDPRLAEDARWSLVSVDGREPTDRQQRKFQHDKNDHDSDSDDGLSRITTAVKPDTLELAEETDEYWLFTFVPDMDQKELVDSVDAAIKIIKDGHYVEFLEIRNKEDIKPGFGTKITRFLTRLTFGPAIDGGPIVPQTVNVRVTGRALFFIGFDETEAIKYSDFEQVIK